MENRKNIWLVLSLIVIAAATRLMPHPPNFTAIGSMALFGGIAISNKTLKYLMPLGALLLSDLILNNTVYASETFSLYYPGMLWVYGSFALIVALGSVLKKLNFTTVLVGSVSSSLTFFLLTNFGYWSSGVLYPLTPGGLIASYIAALPFFLNSLLSTVLFSSIMFGAYYWVDKKVLSPVKA